ncbi:MAG: DUF6036 family nucleotidyltransferase [Chloroflexota bacterium]
MILNQDFKEFIQSLNDHNVRYLVVGGYAVAYHGHPRYTKDLDVWLWIDEQNAGNIVNALSQFGFGSLGLQKSDFLEPGIIVQLGYPPQRIDLITGLVGVVFKECFSKRMEEVIDGVTVPFIDLENLKKNKIASGRPQDIADVNNLQ